MESACLKTPAFVERVLILSILLGLLAIHLFVVHKVAFIGFYFLPVLLAGYFCSRRTTLLLSILAIFLVGLYSLVEPGRMSPKILRKQNELARLEPASPERKNVLNGIAKEKLRLHFSLVVWGSFLVLGAVACSVLHEQKQRKVEELRRAYIQVVELLAKYIELADRQSIGRSVKVAELATAMARRMNLEKEAIESTRMSALLHDLGHKETSALILEKSAELGRESDMKIETFSIDGQEVLRSVNSVLEGVAVVVNAYHEHFVGERRELPPGPVAVEAEIIAVARAYYDLVTGSPRRRPKPPGEALGEIRSSAGKRFSRQIIDALARAIQDGKGQPERRESTQES